MSGRKASGERDASRPGTGRSARLGRAQRPSGEREGAPKAEAPPPAEDELPVVTEPPGASADAATVEADGEGWLGRLAGGVLHELKNPLSTIHLNLELLREEWGRTWSRSQDAKDRRSLRRLDLVLRETRRLDAMIRDVLRFARADRLALAPVDLAALVREVLAFTAPEAAQHDVRVMVAAEEAVRIEADAALVKQAVLNLVQNGLDAVVALGGGEAARRAEAPRGTLSVRVRKAEGGRAAHVEVEDTGTGIAASDVPRLFELYRTTKKDGTGLGLATTKRIAEAHGGRVLFASDGPGKGSRFTLALPVEGPEGGAREGGAGGGSPRAGKPE